VQTVDTEMEEEECAPFIFFHFFLALSLLLQCFRDRILIVEWNMGYSMGMEDIFLPREAEEEE
jgi:hypothetical protein